MEKQGRSGILFRCFKEHTTLKSTFQIKASPGAGEICPQGVKALAPDQAYKIDFHEHTKIGLDICAGTCYNIVRKCGHRTSASISAFQAEEVGSIPIARSIKKDAGSFRTSVFLYTLAPLLASLRILKVKKPLRNPKRKEPGGCLPAASRLDFFSIPDMAKGENSAFAMEIEGVFTPR